MRDSSVEAPLFYAGAMNSRASINRSGYDTLDVAGVIWRLKGWATSGIVTVMPSLVIVVVLMVAAFAIGCVLPANHDIKFLR